MMLDSWRQLLYYPLGLLPSIFFTLRLLLQWARSEKLGRSYVDATFWKLSLVGNVTLLCHYILQVHYPFALLQVANAVIAWRNLDLLRPEHRYSTRTTLCLFLFGFFAVTAMFLIQSYFLIGETDWVRTPTKLLDTTRQYHHFFWHALGALGGTLFASRFWVQWWQAELHQQSELNSAFWWLSIVGSVVTLSYALRIGDTVSILYQAFGFIPYIRNLILIRKNHIFGPARD